MKAIAKFNGTFEQIIWSEFFFEAPMYTFKHSKSKDVWNREKTRNNRYAMVVILFGALMVYHTISFMVKYLHGDIFDLIKFSASADIVGVLSLGFVYNFSGVKRTL